MLDVPKAKPDTSRALHVRGMDDATLVTMRRAANARGMTIKEYIEALVELHQRVRGIEDPRIARILKELRLGEVTL